MAVKFREVVSARESIAAELRDRLVLSRQGFEQRTFTSSPVDAQVTLLRQALMQWGSQHGMRRVCSECFAKVDSNRDAKLQWNSGEIKAFVRALFQQIGANVPRWSELAWSELYRHSDVDGSLSLDVKKAVRFARFCFEARLVSLVPIRTSTSNSTPDFLGGGDAASGMLEPLAPHLDELIAVNHELMAALVVAAAVKPVTIKQTDTDLGQAGGKFRNAFEGNQQKHSKFSEACQRCFRQADGNGDGRLEWNSDEIRTFVRVLFFHFGRVVPKWPAMRWYHLYRSVDIDCSRSLDIAEAEVLARRCLEEMDRTSRKNGGC